jgi:hypothetical protein
MKTSGGATPVTIAGRTRVDDLPPMSFAVVIPLYNKERAIAQTVRSVLNQTRPPDELIIIDDGSTDQSAKTCKTLLEAAKPPFPWKILAQANAGVSAARNRGANEVRSRFIAFLDGDDEWLPGHLAELEKLATDFPEATFLSTRSARITVGGSVMPEPSSLRPGFFGVLTDPFVTYRRSPGLVNSSSAAIRRDAWQSGPDFPVGFAAGEDLFLWLSLLLTETMAHSDAPLTLIHAEHSTIGARMGHVGYNYLHFLGSSEGLASLRSSPALTSYLSANLLGHIVERRMSGDRAVQKKLRRLSRSLPPLAALKCQIASLAPLWPLRCVESVRQLIRDRARSRRQSHQALRG